jgi:hypothetical protein
VKKNHNDSIGNGTHDFPVCRSVPQATAPPTACSEADKWVKTRFAVAKRLDAVFTARRLEFFNKLVSVEFVADNFVAVDLDFLTLVSLQKCSTLIFLLLTKDTKLQSYNLSKWQRCSIKTIISLYSPASSFLLPNWLKQRAPVHLVQCIAIRTIIIARYNIIFY